MYEATQDRKACWTIYKDGQAMSTWIGDRIPQNEEQCKDAAHRLNNGATIYDLPRYAARKILGVWTSGEDWYTPEDAENGYVPSDAVWYDLPG